LAGLSILNRSSNINIDPHWLRVISLRFFPDNVLRLLPLLCLAWSGVAAVPAGAATLQEAQAAFNKQQYDQALQLLDLLGKGGASAPEVRRLKVRTLAKTGKPQDALAEYEGIAKATKKDDLPLLREVAFGFVLPMLKDMRVQMRGAGYTALKEIESEEAIPYFEDGLSDGAGQVRALAAEGLGQFEAGRRSTRLKNALQDQAAYVRKYAVQALGKTGDATLAGLIEKSLEDEEPLVRVAAAGALAALNRPLGWERLRGSAKSRNPDERSAALRTLGLLRKTSSFPELEAAVGDTQPSVRAAAATGLGDLGEKKAGPVLLKALHDPIPGVRGAAVLSLGKLHSVEAVNEVKQALHDSNPGVRADAVAVLLEFDEPYATVSGTVRELMGDKEPGIRARVSRSLSKSRGKSVEDAVEDLRLLLQDVLPLPRMTAVRALGHVTNPRTAAILKEALHDQDDGVRATAAGALIRVLDGKAGTSRSDPSEG
jgi:HEAT repeat protein